MAAASPGNAARRAALRDLGRVSVLAALALAALVLAALPGCQQPMPPEPVVRADPRHPIRLPAWAAGSRPTAPSAVAVGARDDGRVTPGPNSRVSPTPDMAPRVAPADRPELPSTRREVDDLQRELQEQRHRERKEPGPPAGTIDRRPGTIRTTPGTIEVPR